MDDLRGSPLSVGTLEEMIDDNHAIVSSSVGPEYYVNVMSFVNQDLLEPGSSVLLHNKVRCGAVEGRVSFSISLPLSIYLCNTFSGICLVQSSRTK